MHTGYHALIGAAADLPINSPKPIISFSPVVIPAPDRPVDLELRVTVPLTGDALPIILFSHGHGRSNSLSSLEGYAPLCLQSPPGQEMFWQDRATDMVRILDALDAVEAAVPGLLGRFDRIRVAVAGHSAGGWTAAMLLGTGNTDPRDRSTWHKPEPRITAGVVLAGLGNGGVDNVSESGSKLIPFYNPTFTTMATPALVVYGDEDVNPHLSVRGADWHADAYALAPAPKDLLTLRGAKHGLGGISGWDAGETLDESPERLAVVQRMTWAYLTSRLYGGGRGGDGAWAEACKAFERLAHQGTVESK